ncbi:nuclear transport factor 2 family protein [Halomonas denitrificans]|nr:nuclear transport factor 2 family protein [Halomonas denitrificans]
MATDRSGDVRSLARGWIQAWQRMDLAWLREHLAADFVHISPFGRLAGRDHYLATVEPLARKSVNRLEIQAVVADSGRAAVYFENHSAGGVIPSCDWITVRDGRIASVRSFYDTAALERVLSDEDRRGLSED